MKNFYLFLSAACVAVSASAVEKEMAVAKYDVAVPADVRMIKVESAPQLATRANLSVARKTATRADEQFDYVYFRPASNVMAIGSSVNGYGYSNVLGFASSYGDIVFNNYSLNAKSYNWTYSEVGDYEVQGNNIVFNEKTTNAQTLVLKSTVGPMKAPELSVEYNSGKKGTYADKAVQYFCGAFPSYWLGNDDEGGIFGVTFYQNNGLENPEGYNGSMGGMNAYSVVDKGFDKNGVYNEWKTDIEKELGGKEISDLTIDNFTIIQPKPASTYFITQGWGWFNITANAATQLVSNIYLIDDEGNIAENPIATGYASVPKGETSTPLFTYFPIDEEGNELEGEVFIDSAVAITVEGFAGNPAIDSIFAVSGYYPVSYEAYVAYAQQGVNIINAPSLRVHLTFSVDGESVDALMYDSGLYYYDQRKNPLGEMIDGDTLSLLGYAQFMTDATFAFINPSQESVNVPLEGGKAELEYKALYYNINDLIEAGLYELSAPDWVKVEFGESSQQTGLTPVTLTVAPSQEGRTGVVSLKGLGVSGDIKVVQGEGSGVGIVSADKDVKYYDLTGRRVLNPEKGAYIKMTGNKSEKVMF